MKDLEPEGPSRWDLPLAYLQLLRMPNLFTAMADVTMGFLFVLGGDFEPRDGWRLGLLIAASTLLYAGGVVLNDVFDYRLDLEERPERPLPSERIARATAGWLGLGLLVIGAGLAGTAALLTGLARPGIVAGLLVVCILLYDGWLKRTPLGPLAMGGCRMLNVLLGMSVTPDPWLPEHWLVAGAIGVYIVGVTWLARRETRRSGRLQLALATAVMIGGIGLLAWLPSWAPNLPTVQRIGIDRWHLLVGLMAALIGWRCVHAVLDPRPSMVQIAVKQAIVSLVMVDAIACFAMRDMPGAIAVFLFLVPTVFFAQFVRST